MRRQFERFHLSYRLFFFTGCTNKSARSFDSRAADYAAFDDVLVDGVSEGEEIEPKRLIINESRHGGEMVAADPLPSPSCNGEETQFSAAMDPFPQKFGFSREGGHFRKFLLD